MFTNEYGEPNGKGIAVGCASVFVIVVLIWLLSGVKIINPTEVGIKVNFGTAEEKTLESGIHYALFPFADIRTMDTRVVLVEQDGESASKDLQSVFYKVAVSYHINKENMYDIFMRLGNSDGVKTAVVFPAISETQKAITSKYNAEEILTKREEIKKSIDTDLRVRLEKFNIVLDEVSIVNINFSPEYNKAIEEKQVAQQNALKAQYQKDEAKVLAEKKVIEAEAQAKAQQLLQSSLTKEMVTKMWIEKWNGILPTTMTGDSDLIMNLK